MEISDGGFWSVQRSAWQNEKRKVHWQRCRDCVCHCAFIFFFFVKSFSRNNWPEFWGPYVRKNFSVWGSLSATFMQWVPHSDKFFLNLSPRKIWSKFWGEVSVLSYLLKGCWSRFCYRPKLAISKFTCRVLSSSHNMVNPYVKPTWQQNVAAWLIWWARVPIESFTPLWKISFTWI